MRVPRVRPAFPLLLALTLSAALGPAEATAQEDREYSRFTGSMALLNTQPTGTLATGPGWGAGIHAAWALDPFRIVRVRAEFRAAIYDHESRQVCVTSCLIQAELDTSHGLMYAGLGPEIALPLGPVQLALSATAGYLGFSTSSSLEGKDAEDEDIFTTTNHQDGVLGWAAGSELRVPLGQQADLSLGVHYLAGREEVSYLRTGAITEHPDGSVTFDAIRTDANMMAFTLGVAFRPFVGSLTDDGG